MSKLYQLKQTLTFNRPQSWETHTRYALLIRGEAVTVKQDSWLLEIGSQITYDQQVEYLYRLATGEMVALERPLSIADNEVRPVTWEQALLAMQAFRTLEQAALEDWGIHIEHIYHLPPFRLIKCPLCGQAEFTSVDFAGVTCEACYGRFQVRYTSGDPGFTVDCAWSDYYYGTARLMMPRSNFLSMYMVFKNSGDPCDLSCDDCRCDPDNPNLTGQDDISLRPGLHTCRIGDVYDWRLSGWVPDYIELNRQARATGWQIDGQWWPACAYIRTASLLDDELHALRRLHRALSAAPDAAGDDLAALNNLLARTPRKPVVFAGLSGRSIPDLAALETEERYLLHHWLLTRDEQLELAWPVWYVVKPVLGQKRTGGLRPIEAWEIIRRDICPCCARLVTDEEMAANALVGLEGRTSSHPRHHCCRKVWAEGGWQPYLDAVAVAAGA